MSLLMEKKFAAANELLVSKLEREISAIKAQAEVDRIGFESGVPPYVGDGDQILDEMIAEIEKTNVTSAIDVAFPPFD